MTEPTFDPEWIKDLVSGKRSRTAADIQFLNNNQEKWVKALKLLLDLLYSEQ